MQPIHLLFIVWWLVIATWSGSWIFATALIPALGAILLYNFTPKVKFANDPPLWWIMSYIVPVFAMAFLSASLICTAINAMFGLGVFLFLLGFLSCFIFFLFLE